MVLKLKFYDKTKNNQIWWNRLLDRISGVKDRKWVVKGGGPLGSDECEFRITYEDGSNINEQRSISEITWCFFIEQLHIDKFFVDGKDVTSILSNR